jgi:FkbM family methyltransferase
MQCTATLKRLNFQSVDQKIEGIITMLQAARRQLRKALRTLVPDRYLHRRHMLNLSRFAQQRGLALIERDLFFDLTRDHTVLRIKHAHMFYLHHMIESFDYYVNSVEPLQVDGNTLVDMSGPRYHRLKGFAAIPFLFPSHTEPYETTSAYLNFADLRSGQVVLDIGAYSGVTSIIFAQAVGPTGHVFAFEADEANYHCARINIDMAAQVMGLKNITLVNKAVWSHGDGLLFSNEGAMGSSAVNITGGSRGRERVVPSTRIQDFVAENGIDHADFVKIDIEGCEIEVLESSAAFLHTMRSKLIIEPHHVSGTLSTEPCCRLLEAAGYKVDVREAVAESEQLIEAVP